MAFTDGSNIAIVTAEILIQVWGRNPSNPATEQHATAFHVISSSIYDVNLPAVWFSRIVYPIQLNRVEGVQFEGDLQGLENKHIHCCLSLRGGAVTQKLWSPAELSVLSLYGFDPKRPPF